MAIRSYVDFFRAVAENAPLPINVDSLKGRGPTALIVSTGLGKTAAVIGAWLYRRLNGRRKERFTALFHHISLEMLRMASSRSGGRLPPAWMG